MTPAGGHWQCLSLKSAALDLSVAPRLRKRPADVIGNAVKVMRIATGEGEEEFEQQPQKDEAAAALGRKGGKARAEKMTAERRAEIVRKAAASRWKKDSESDT